AVIVYQPRQLFVSARGILTDGALVDYVPFVSPALRLANPDICSLCGAQVLCNQEERFPATLLGVIREVNILAVRIDKLEGVVPSVRIQIEPLRVFHSCGRDYDAIRAGEPPLRP